MAAFEELAETLAGVTDATSMNEARRRLKNRAEVFATIARKARGLGDPSLQVKEQLREEGQKLENSFNKVRQEVARMVALPGGREYLAQFPSLGGLVPEEPGSPMNPGGR